MYCCACVYTASLICYRRVCCVGTLTHATIAIASTYCTITYNRCCRSLPHTIQPRRALLKETSSRRGRTIGRWSLSQPAIRGIPRSPFNLNHHCNSHHALLIPNPWLGSETRDRKKSSRPSLLLAVALQRAHRSDRSTPLMSTLT